MTVERAQVCEVGVEPLEASLPKRYPTLLESLVASDGCDRSFLSTAADATVECRLTEKLAQPVRDVSSTMVADLAIRLGVNLASVDN